MAAARCEKQVAVKRPDRAACLGFKLKDRVGEYKTALEIADSGDSVTILPKTLLPKTLDPVHARELVFHPAARYTLSRQNGYGVGDRAAWAFLSPIIFR
jgi:hypothetical protein